MRFFDLARSGWNTHSQAMDPHARAWALAAACAVCLTACGSGQTGSPAEKPPRYQTSARFSSDRGVTGTGGPSGGPGLIEQESNRPTWNDKGSDLAALLPNHRLVEAIEGRGVVVYDVSVPSTPRIIGEVAIDGALYQLQP